MQIGGEPSSMRDYVFVLHKSYMKLTCILLFKLLLTLQKILITCSAIEDSH